MIILNQSSHSHLGCSCNLLRIDLVSHIKNCLRVGADEFHSDLLEISSEMSVLREESISRMHLISFPSLPIGVIQTHGLCSSVLDSLEDLIHSEIGLIRGSGSYTDCLISQSNVEGIGIDVGMDGDCLDSHCTRCLDHTTRDLS